MTNTHTKRLATATLVREWPVDSGSAREYTLDKPIPLDGNAGGVYRTADRLIVQRTPDNAAGTRGFPLTAVSPVVNGVVEYDYYWIMVPQLLDDAAILAVLGVKIAVDKPVPVTFVREKVVTLADLHEATGNTFATSVPVGRLLFFKADNGTKLAVGELLHGTSLYQLGETVGENRELFVSAEKLSAAEVLSRNGFVVKGVEDDPDNVDRGSDDSID